MRYSRVPIKQQQQQVYRHLSCQQQTQSITAAAPVSIQNHTLSQSQCHSTRLYSPSDESTVRPNSVDRMKLSARMVQNSCKTLLKNRKHHCITDISSKDGSNYGICMEQPIWMNNQQGLEVNSKKVRQHNNFKTDKSTHFQMKSQSPLRFRVAFEEEMAHQTICLSPLKSKKYSLQTTCQNIQNRRNQIFKKQQNISQDCYNIILEKSSCFPSSQTEWRKQQEIKSQLSSRSKSNPQKNQIYQTGSQNQKIITLHKQINQTLAIMTTLAGREKEEGSQILISIQGQDESSFNFETTFQATELIKSSRKRRNFLPFDQQTGLSSSGLFPYLSQPLSLHQQFQQEQENKQKQQFYIHQKLPSVRQRGNSAQEAVSAQLLSNNAVIQHRKGALKSPKKLLRSLHFHKLNHDLNCRSNQEKQFFSCFFIRGNNSGLVKKVLLTRSNWRESSVYSCNINFRWHPFSKGIKYENNDSNAKTIVNHFEFHSEITTKNGLIKNLTKYCSDRGMNVFDITPCTFLLCLNEKSWDTDLIRFCEFFYNNLPEALQDRNEYQKIIMNIQSKFQPLTIRKDNKSNQNIINQIGDFLGSIDNHVNSSNPYEMALHSTFLGANSASYMWLLKPTNLNRGRGIELFSDLNQLETLLNNYFEGFYEQPLVEEIKGKENEKQKNEMQENDQEMLLQSQHCLQMNLDNITINNLQKEVNILLQRKLAEKEQYHPLNTLKLNGSQQMIQASSKTSTGISAEFGGTLMKEHSFVIQKYIERPLLLGGRKFDIRMWVLVTGSLDVYLFKEGYIRTSSKPFDLSDTNDIFVHLTNNAIQKYSENYGQFESGNQLSLKQFDEYMKASGQINRSFRKDIMPSIEEIVMMSMLSVGKQLNANDRKVSFELFGYDFFVDSDFKVWLIEVNTNPCIEESSPLLGMLIPRMIDDALKLTVDVLFPPQYAEGDEKLNIINVNNTPQKNSKQYDNNSNELSQDCNNSNKSSNLSGKNTGVLNGNVSNTDQKGNAIRPSLFPVDGYSSESMFNFLLNLNKHQ